MTKDSIPQSNCKPQPGKDTTRHNRRMPQRQISSLFKATNQARHHKDITGNNKTPQNDTMNGNHKRKWWEYTTKGNHERIPLKETISSISQSISNGLAWRVHKVAIELKKNFSNWSYPVLTTIQNNEKVHTFDSNSLVILSKWVYYAWRDMYRWVECIWTGIIENWNKNMQ